MALSAHEISGLRLLEPKMLNEPYILFFDIFAVDESLKDEHFIEKSKFDNAFYNIAKLSSPKKEWKSRKIELVKISSEMIHYAQKANFLVYDHPHIASIQKEELIEFGGLLKFIKKSHDKLIRWAIFYIINKSDNSFSNLDVKEILKDFKINKLNDKIYKVLEESGRLGLDYDYIDDDNVQIKTDKKSKLLINTLLEPLHFLSRRSPDQLYHEILDLLDEGSYSNQEIELTLSVNKSQVSKTMRRLKEEKLIIHSSFGEKGSEFFTTNCKRCPFGTDEASCRKKSINSLLFHFSKKLDLHMKPSDFDKFSNQTLLAVDRVFRVPKEQHRGIEEEKNALYDLIFTEVMTRLAVELQEGKNEAVKIINKIKNQPFEIFSSGFSSGAAEGMLFTTELIQKSLEGILSKKEQDKFIKSVAREYNKIFKNEKLALK